MFSQLLHWAAPYLWQLITVGGLGGTVFTWLANRWWQGRKGRQVALGKTPDRREIDEIKHDHQNEKNLWKVVKTMQKQIDGCSRRREKCNKTLQEVREKYIEARTQIIGLTTNLIKLRNRVKKLESKRAA